MLSRLIFGINAGAAETPPHPIKETTNQIMPSQTKRPPPAAVAGYQQQVTALRRISIKHTSHNLHSVRGHRPRQPGQYISPQLHWPQDRQSWPRVL